MVAPRSASGWRGERAACFIVEPFGRRVGGHHGVERFGCRHRGRGEVGGQRHQHVARIAERGFFLAGVVPRFGEPRHHHQ